MWHKVLHFIHWFLYLNAYFKVAEVFGKWNRDVKVLPNALKSPTDDVSSFEDDFCVGGEIFLFWNL